ncbi:MAG: hypothetical protein GY801_02710 [bacterium]|nr:hypothetical protein [bacterium]
MVLTQTGWFGFPEPPDVDEADIFTLFQNNWTDSNEKNGGLMNFGWEWWFSGTAEPPTSGFAKCITNSVHINQNFLDFS